MSQIRALASELAAALTPGLTLDAPAALELGRLAAKLELLTEGTLATGQDPIAPRPAPSPTSAPRKRIRLEKRPMRRAERVLDGPDGHRVVFDFHTFEITEHVPGREPFTRRCKDRKELWAQLRAIKAHFRRMPAPTPRAANF